MAKAPTPGRVKTRLVPPLTPDEAADFYAAMLADTIAWLQEAAVGTVHAAVTPAEFDRSLLPPTWNVFPQITGDLGARLTAAFARVCDRMPSPVIAFGVDSPTLPPAYVHRAAAALVRADVVLGPTEDGGCYAIGLRNVPAAFFRGVAWSTAAVCRQLAERAEQRGLTCHVLPAWYDLDTEDDIERHWTSLTRTRRAPRTRAWLLHAFPRPSSIRAAH